MHDAAYDYFKRWFRCDVKKTVLELGSLDVNSSAQGLVLRTLGKDMKWTGVDLKEGPGVDLVVEAGKKLPFKDSSFDWILSAEMLEHDPEPQFSLREWFRMCKVGGRMIMTTTSGTRKHHNPPHYWNFWPEAIYYLVSNAGWKVLHLELLEHDLRCVAQRAER